MAKCHCIPFQFPSSHEFALHVMTFHDMSVYVISFQVMSSHLVAFMSFYIKPCGKMKTCLDRPLIFDSVLYPARLMSTCADVPTHFQKLSSEHHSM